MLLSHNVNSKAFCTPAYSLCEKFLNDEEIQNMIEYFESKPLDEAVVGAGNSTTILKTLRKSNVSFHYPDTKNHWIFDKIDFLIHQVNNQIYNFDLTGYDYLQYTTYDKEGEYNFHVDTNMDIDQFNGNEPLPRKLSISILLNEPEVEFKGGNFKFYYKSEPSELQLSKGTAVIFPSYMLHGVNPILSGVRKSLVVWVQGPKFR